MMVRSPSPVRPKTLPAQQRAPGAESLRPKILDASLGNCGGPQHRYLPDHFAAFLAGGT
jgi:hypothetical protein